MDGVAFSTKINVTENHARRQSIEGQLVTIARLGCRVHRHFLLLSFCPMTLDFGHWTLDTPILQTNPSKFQWTLISLAIFVFFFNLYLKYYIKFEKFYILYLYFYIILYYIIISYHIISYLTLINNWNLSKEKKRIILYWSIGKMEPIYYHVKYM